MIAPLLLVVITLILAYIGSHEQLSRPQLVFVGLFFGAGGVFVLFPRLATRVAGLLSVGRGTDLLLYFAVMCGVLIAANFYFRFKQTERALVEITRRIALASPLIPSKERDAC